MKRQGRIIVISAPSGSGKTTLCKRLLKECKNLVFSRSLTTRPARKGERNKKDYIFISKKEFMEYRRAGKFLEWARVFGNYYGTPEEFVEKKLAEGKDAVLVIDVQGAFQVKAKRPGAVLIFILPPSLEEVRNRLIVRKTDQPRQIKLRLKVAAREIAKAKEYDYVVVNDDLDAAVSRLKEIINKGIADEKKRSHNRRYGFHRCL